MKILISGAGIAGTCLAYWLQRHGFEPTLVERAPGLRTGEHCQPQPTADPTKRGEAPPVS